MAKAHKTAEPWFGSFTPADPNAPPLPLEPEPSAPSGVPEAVPPVPNVYPAGITYEAFLYSLIQDMEQDILALGGGTGFMPVITDPNDGDVLIYNSLSQTFINVTQDSLLYLPLTGGTITGTPGTLVINAPNAFTGNILAAQVNNSRRFVVDADGDAIFELTDTSNSGPTATVRISHRTSSGTPTTGFGSALQFWGEDTAHTNLEFATIRTEAASNTVGAVDADLVFLQKIAGTSTEGLRFHGTDGRAAFAGAVQSPALHIGDLVTHPAVAHISRAAPAADPLFPLFRVKATADTAIVSEPTDFEIDLGAIHQLTTGHRTSPIRAMNLVAPIYAAVGASVIDEAVGVFFNTLPSAGTNVTITKRLAAQFNGPVEFLTGGVSEGISYVWRVASDDTPVGASVGRIPISVGGALRYVPYHAA